MSFWMMSEVLRFVQSFIKDFHVIRNNSDKQLFTIYVRIRIKYVSHPITELISKISQVQY